MPFKFKAHPIISDYIIYSQLNKGHNKSMKLKSTREKYYQITNQLIVDFNQSFFGEVMGSFIQPAQGKAILPHVCQEELFESIKRKCHSLEKKLDDEDSAFIYKWALKLEKYRLCLKATSVCSHDYFILKTIEGRSLDAVHVYPESYTDVEPSEQFYNIHLLGAGQRLGNRLVDLYREAARQQKNVIAFDYSNVGYSKGPKISSLNRLLADASAMVSMLLEQGVPANHITLHGLSLGGLVATLLSAAYHQAGFDIKIYTANAPMELTSCVMKMISDKAGFSNLILNRIINYVLNRYGWEADGISAWDSIPELSKEYSIITAESSAQHIDDNTIPHVATITGKHQLSLAYNSKETDKKCVAIERFLTSTISSSQRESLIAYKRTITSLPLSEHHHFHLFKTLEKKINPHGTQQYLLRNLDQSPEDLYDDFSSFVTIKNEFKLNS